MQLIGVSEDQSIFIHHGTAQMLWSTNHQLQTPLLSKLHQAVLIRKGYDSRQCYRKNTTTTPRWLKCRGSKLYSIQYHFNKCINHHLNMIIQRVHQSINLCPIVDFTEIKNNNASSCRICTCASLDLQSSCPPTLLNKNDNHTHPSKKKTRQNKQHFATETSVSVMGFSF